MPRPCIHLRNGGAPAVVLTLCALALCGCSPRPASPAMKETLQLAPAAGEASYKGISDPSERFLAAYRASVATGGTTKADLAPGEVATFEEIAGIYGGDALKDNKSAADSRWSSGGVNYLLLDIVFNVQGNNSPHRFLIFRPVGAPDADRFEKVLDYEWEDGWSHPSWYFKEDGLYIAAWLKGIDEKRTFQLTRRVLVDGKTLTVTRRSPPQ